MISFSYNLWRDCEHKDTRGRQLQASPHVCNRVFMMVYIKVWIDIDIRVWIPIGVRVSIEVYIGGCVPECRGFEIGYSPERYVAYIFLLIHIHEYADRLQCFCDTGRPYRACATTSNANKYKYTRGKRYVLQML